MTQHASRDNARLRAVFEAVCAAEGVELGAAGSPASSTTASWFEARGVRSALVGRFGKLADWVLLSRTRDGRATASFQAALGDAGKPVLLLPRALPAFSLDTVLVAWDGSSEASRALSAAFEA